MSANGARFHLAEAGPDGGPLVVLLHGFPQFWWAWRHQLTGLADRGYRTVALDLRGYGASDKPPRGYDTITSAADVAGVIRSLGDTEAVVIGQDWGAWVAWSMPTLQPRTTRAIATVAAPHPLLLQSAALARHSPAALPLVLSFQVPIRPERMLQRAGYVGGLLRRWAGPGWPSAEEERRYEEAMRVPFVAHSAMEYYRWAFRSLPRRDGRRFADAVRHTVPVPVLQVHGSADTFTSAHLARRSSSFVRGRYRWELVDGAGHYPPEEEPRTVTALLADWLGTL